MPLWNGLYLLEKDSLLERELFIPAISYVYGAHYSLRILVHQRVWVQSCLLLNDKPHATAADWVDTSPTHNGKISTRLVGIGF